MALTQILARLGLACMAGVLGAAALAQDYPNRTVRIVVPYPAGGQPDLLARTLGQHMSTQFGQPFVIENIPGSGAVAAVTNILSAPADGHTLFTGDAGLWAVNPAMRVKNSYDFWRDFTPVRQTHITSLILAVGPSMPKVKDFREFVALVKASPGQFSYGSAGIGSIQHLTMEGLKTAHGLDILHVPFKSGATAMPAMIGGQISMMITAFSTVASFAKAGDNRITVLGTTTKDRSKLSPNTPALAEYFVADFDFGSGGAILVRAGTPRPVIDKLATAIDKALNAPDTVARMKTLSIDYIEKSSPEAAAEYIRKDIVRYTAAAKAANVAGTQ